jgi:hypothetical protein
MTDKLSYKIYLHESESHQRVKKKKNLVQPILFFSKTNITKMSHNVRAVGQWPVSLNLVDLLIATFYELKDKPENPYI